MKRLVSAVALVASMLLAGCEGAKQLASTLGDLRTVQKDVAQVVACEQVTVNLMNNRYLRIALVNSPSAGLPDDARREKALQAARAAYAALSSRASLDSVVVTFVKHRRYFLVFYYRQSTDSFAFEPGDLKAAPAPPTTL